MPIKVKDVATVTAKWNQRAQAASPDYVAGINNPKNDQAQAAAAAAPTWAAGVQGAIQSGAFAKGVNAAGTAKWKNNSLNKGAQRYPTGIAGAQQDFSKGIGPVLQTIANVDLPPRQPKGNPANIQRVTAITQALRALKTGG